MRILKLRIVVQGAVEDHTKETNKVPQSSGMCLLWRTGELSGEESIADNDAGKDLDDAFLDSASEGGLVKSRAPLEDSAPNDDQIPS